MSVRHLKTISIYASAVAIVAMLSLAVAEAFVGSTRWVATDLLLAGLNLAMLVINASDRKNSRP